MVYMYILNTFKGSTGLFEKQGGMPLFFKTCLLNLEIIREWFWEGREPLPESQGGVRGGAAPRRRIENILKPIENSVRESIKEH